jgi:hypothetical protein
MAEYKRKRCKWCESLFAPFNSLQKVCSSKCALEYSKKVKQENAEKMKELLDKRKDDKSIEEQKKYTKTIVHAYVRERDKYKPCISCGCRWNDEFQAGHYHKAELFNAIRFDVMNIHGQCFKCNIHLDGNLDEYKLRLPERIGVEEYEKLSKRAKIAKMFGKQWTKTELKTIRTEIKKLTKWKEKDN